MYVPWEQPFADPEIYENPVLLSFLDRYWGTEDYRITCYHSNSPYPGSEYQRWHRDAGISRMVPHVGLEVCPHFGVKFPLVDTYEENGSFEIMPSTQYLADPAMEDSYDEILESGDFPSRRRLNLKKGTLWIQDPRTPPPRHAQSRRPRASRAGDLLFAAVVWADGCDTDDTGRVRQFFGAGQADGRQLQGGWLVWGKSGIYQLVKPG